MQGENIIVSIYCRVVSSRASVLLLLLGAPVEGHRRPLTA